MLFVRIFFFYCRLDQLVKYSNWAKVLSYIPLVWVWVNTSTYIKGRCGEEDMCGLGDVCSMETVVVRYVSMVMVLQGHHISDKGVDWDTKRLQQLSLLRRRRREKRSQNFTQSPSGVHRVHEQTHKHVSCSWRKQTAPHIHTEFTWKMAYMMQLRGLLLENSATLNILKLHLSRSSNSWLNSKNTENIKGNCWDKKTTTLCYKS